MPAAHERVHLRTGQLVLASANASKPWIVATVAVLMALAWGVTWWTGGTRGAFVHVFYLPIMLGAVHFRHRGTLVTAVVAGLLAGALMPLDVATGESQAPANWLLRLGFFVLIGQFVTYLCTTTVADLRSRVAESRWKSTLDQALAGGEFRLVYQPLFELRTGRLMGVEALLRWTSPTLGEMSPEEFIPLAEQAGAIDAIGDFVLRTAAAQGRRWLDETPPATSFYVAVNMSPRQLADPHLARKVETTLEEAGLPASSLHVELTETAVIEDVATAIARVEQLRAIGVKVALDDFGTGQSSLAYLHQFQADIIKIDRRFVQAIDNNRAAALAAGVVRLAKSLGATTIAEGVETEAQADVMRNIGCDGGQGYYYSRPAPADLISRILPMAASDCRGAGSPRRDRTERTWQRHRR